MQLLKWDGHVHSPYCPHGTKDPLEAYIERALEQGLERISFTEHAPLPEGVTDPAPDNDSGMSFATADAYLKELTHLRETYKNQIDIRIGMEFDYWEGHVDGTRDIIARYADVLTDGILSLHYLYIDEQYYGVDFSKESFGEIVTKLGSVTAVHERYYEGIQALVMTDLGAHQPKRLGHLTLPTKFIQAYPELLQVTQSLSIPLVYGSDAHLAKDVGADFDFKW